MTRVYRSNLAALNTIATSIAALGALLLLASACVFTWWACIDRQPPFILTTVNKPEAEPGQPVIVDMQVWRDVDRGCAVTYSRFFYDAQGVKHDVMGAQGIDMTAADLVAFEHRSPGRSRVAFVIPAEAAPGQGDLSTSLAYVCNPAQRLFPILIVLHVPVVVLEPSHG